MPFPFSDFGPLSSPARTWPTEGVDVKAEEEDVVPEPRRGIMDDEDDDGCDDDEAVVVGPVPPVELFARSALALV